MRALIIQSWIKRKDFFLSAETTRDLQTAPKGDPRKLKLAQHLHARTTMTLKWIARRLHTGAWTHLNNHLYHAQVSLTRNRRLSGLRDCQGLPMIVSRWILTAVVLTGMCSMLCGCQRRVILQQRVEDVRKLVNLHADHSFTNTAMAELIRIANEKGVTIRSPIPKNPSEPCYEIVPFTTNTLSAVVIQETSNVDDARLIVRGYSGGYVTTDKK